MANQEKARKRSKTQNEQNNLHLGSVLVWVPSMLTSHPGWNEILLTEKPGGRIRINVSKLKHLSTPGKCWPMAHTEVNIYVEKWKKKKTYPLGFGFRLELKRHSWETEQAYMSTDRCGNKEVMMHIHNGISFSHKEKWMIIFAGKYVELNNYYYIKINKTDSETPSIFSHGQNLDLNTHAHTHIFMYICERMSLNVCENLGRKASRGRWEDIGSRDMKGKGGLFWGGEDKQKGGTQTSGWLEMVSECPYGRSRDTSSLALGKSPTSCTLASVGSCLDEVCFRLHAWEKTNLATFQFPGLKHTWAYIKWEGLDAELDICLKATCTLPRIVPIIWNGAPCPPAATPQTQSSQRSSPTVSSALSQDCSLPRFTAATSPSYLLHSSQSFKNVTFGCPLSVSSATALHPQALSHTITCLAAPSHVTHLPHVTTWRHSHILSTFSGSIVSLSHPSIYSRPH